MLTLNPAEGLSPVILTVLLIAYLTLVELGNKRTKNSLLPFVIALTVTFLIIAIKSIYEVYMKIA